MALTLTWDLLRKARGSKNSAGVLGGVDFGELQAFSGLSSSLLTGFGVGKIAPWQKAYDSLYGQLFPAAAPKLPSASEIDEAAKRKTALENLAKRGRLTTVLTGAGLTSDEKTRRKSSILGGTSILGM
jgi:hypothetical protein